MSWTVSTWVAAALLAVCGGQISVHEGNWISSTGYHVCTRNESRNVSFLVVQKVPYTVTKPCDGWLLWKTCTVTVTRMVSRTEYRTEWQQVPGCCDGYEQAGRYCVLPVNRSGEFTAKPGFCPTACGLDPGSEDCELDIDCPGWQKCCQLYGRSLCTDPASSSNYPENGGNRLNATVTVKTDYQQLMSESNGLLHHLRLLQSMVCGALQSKVRVYYLHSWPVHPYRTASSLLIHYGAPLLPHNVTWRLHLLLKHITEVSSVTVRDIDECAHAALRRCSGQAVCNNTMGSYQCSCHHGYVDVDPRNPGANCTADVNGSTPTAAMMTDHPTTNTVHTSTSSPAPPPSMSSSAGPHQTTCAPPSISSLWATNVTGASFSVCWSSRLQTNQTYLVVVSRGSEMVVSRETNETMMEVRLLTPGALYNVTVTPCTCGNRGASLHVFVKTDARALDATARITNVPFTADLHNTSSQAYKNLAGGIIEQIYQSLSPDIRPMVDLDQVRIEITGFSQGSVVVNFTIISAPTQSHDITNVSNALLDSLVNSSTYTVDKKNTNISDVDECASGDHDCSQWANCTNTWASYNCACPDGFIDNNPERQGRACQAIATMEPTTLALTASTSPRTQITPWTNTITTIVLKNVSGSTTIPTLTTTPTATAKTTTTTNNTLPTAQTTTTTLTPTNNTIPTISTTAQTTTTTLTPTNNTIPTISTTAQTTTTTLTPTNNTIPTISTTVQTTTTTLTPANDTIPTISTTAQTTHTTLKATNNTLPTISITAHTTTTPLTPTNNTIPTISKTAQTTITDPTISTTLPTSTNDTSPTMNSVAVTTIRTSTIANNTISIVTTTAPITMIASTSTINATSSIITTASATNSAPTTTNNNNTVPLTNTVHPTTSIANITAPTTTLSPISKISPTDLTTTSTITTTSTPKTSITLTTSHAAVTTGTPLTTSTHALVTTRIPTIITSPVTSLATGTPKTITAPATTSTTPEPSTPAVRNLQGHLSVQCRDAAIIVSIAKDFLLSANIQEGALYLGSVACGVNGDNGTHLQLTVAWNECDTELVEKETHYTASVILFNSMDSYTSAGGEEKEPTLRLKVPIMCTFPKKMLISADFGSTGYNMIQENFTGSGSFQVKVRLMNGSVPLPQNYSLSPEEAVVVEVSLNTSSELIKLVITSCWATATPNPIDVNRYTFLENSCTQNGFTKVLANGNSSTSGVSVQIFSIVDLNVIYLHCRVQICLQIGAGSCVPDCRQRTARSGKTVGRSFGSIGPIFKTEEAGSLDDELSILQIVGFSCLGVGLSLFFIIGFICLFFYQRNRIGHYNFSIKPKEENFTYLVFNT